MLVDGRGKRRFLSGREIGEFLADSMGLWKCLWVKGGPLSGLCVWELPKSVYALFNALIKGSALVELTIFTAGKHVKISRTTNICLLFRIDPKRSILTSFQGLLGGSFGVLAF